jgi:hypothetical protein
MKLYSKLAFDRHFPIIVNQICLAVPADSQRTLVSAAKQ